MLTDDDFRRAPDPQRQIELAKSGRVRPGGRDRGPGTIAWEAEHGRPVCPVAKVVKGKTLMQVFAEEAETVKPKRRRGMNKLEAEYAAKLEADQRAGRIKWFAFEAITLKLADDCRYTPDFALLHLDGRLEFRETKGWWRDDAKVKIRVAVRMFPWAKFVAIRKRRKKDGGGWEVEEF